MAEWWSCVLSCTRSTNSVVVLCVQSTTDSAFVHLISWVLNRIWRLVDHILLELSTVLVFHWDRLHWLLLVVVHVVIKLIRIDFDILLLTWWNLMASYSWTCAWILWVIWFSTHRYSITTSIFFFHLLIQRFSLIEYLHQFFIHFVTIKLFQNLFLMFKLILRLFGLFRSLLFLNESISILWFCSLLTPWCYKILSVTLSSSFGWCACFWLLSVVWFLIVALLILLLLIERLSITTHAQILLICGSEIVVVYNVHRQWLVRQATIMIIPTNMAWSRLITSKILTKQSYRSWLLTTWWLSLKTLLGRLAWFIWFCRFTKFILKL